MAKVNEAGSLNCKIHIWSFHIVYNHALKLSTGRWSKGNLQTKHQGIGAAAIIKGRASTTSPRFSFHHMHFLNCSSLS